ncbi:hypothetical protein C0583_02320 [Candidatus Parcubacteria bacterium]|nr:MAG: hypothetical protein C0583_02320 [Candidatus Parcubacteria bacterium]
MGDRIHLATISILIKDRQTHSGDVNDILSKHGKIIMARLGVNVQRSCVAYCTGMITVACEGRIKEIKALTKELNDLYGIVAKVNIMTD